MTMVFRASGFRVKGLWLKLGALEFGGSGLGLRVVGVGFGV